MRKPAFLLVLSLALLAGCVTINVYFPAAAAEKAADKIIEDVWGADKSSESEPKRDDNKQTAAHEDARAQSMLLAAAASVLDFIVTPARAQANLNIETPAIRQLTQSMEVRHGQLKKYYDAGSIGLTRDGLVQVRDQNLVPLPERNSVRKLVAEENADRTNLYREIASANGHAEWETDIRTTFAERWASKAPAGWWYQDESGAWKQK